MTNRDTVLKQIKAAVTDQLDAKLSEFLAEQGKPERWIDADEAARHLRCSRQRVYDLVAQAKKQRTSENRGGNREGAGVAVQDPASRGSHPPGIPYAREGSRLLFKRSELDRWVRSG